MNLLVFGLGYSSLHYLNRHAAGFARVSGTVRSEEKAERIRATGIETFVFPGAETDPDMVSRLAEADALLVSVPPDARGDPALLALHEAIEAAPFLQKIVYLSTVGVYGDHGGDLVDESTLCRPTNPRSLWRVAAERNWLALDNDARRVQVLRLAGTYGPGRNALVNLMDGSARRIIKPGQIFNRIHVADIGGAIDAAFRHDGESAVWNVSDDEPSPPQDVVAFAAELLGVDPPPEIAFEDADMTPMAKSFYSEAKRVSNAALKEKLGVTLLYPTYREGLRALQEELAHA